MAKIYGDFSGVSGSFGDNYVGRQTKNGAVLAKRPRKTSTPRRSEKQMNVRGQLGNVAANHRLYEGKHSMGFEGKPAGCNEFNMMVQVNYGVNPVFLTRQERLNGGCVVAPYQYCRGSLRSINAEVNAGGVLVSDLSLGSLVIGAQTTVAEFAAAVLSNNTGWADMDQVTFFYAKQYIDTVTLVPRATMDAWKVVLDVNDESLLYQKVTALGFTSISDGNGGYVLGMNAVLVNAGASWAHSREEANGSLKIGSQRLVVVSDILADYMGQAALKRCADSYGGVNTKAVYLNPSSSVEMLYGGGSTGGGITDSGNGGTTGNTGGDNTGGGSGTNTNPTNPSGGSGTITTVAAPTFAGETQFTESTQVSMSAEAGATIHYTLDGSTPTAESAVYSAPITLSDTTTVKAIAVKDGVSSSVTSRVYTKGGNGGGDGEGSGDME